MTTEEQIEEPFEQQELEELAEHSPLAKQFVDRNLFEHCKLITLANCVGGIEINNLHEGFSFHPYGDCGCIELPDDYMFGIRCDHLMWSDGACEGTEEFLPGYCPSILIYGNHKGHFTMKLIYVALEFFETEEERKDRLASLRRLIKGFDED